MRRGFYSVSVRGGFVKGVIGFKGTFGNQDENTMLQARVVGKENMNYPWLDTRTRYARFTKWSYSNFVY